jgi:hypothetical protein
MAPRRGARQQSVPDSGHRGSPSGPDAQESTTIPESQVFHTLLPVCSTENSVCSTENSVTVQDTMPTLQPLREGEEHSVTVEEPMSRTPGFEDDLDPELLLVRRSSKSCVANAQAQKDAVTATLIESN